MNCAILLFHVSHLFPSSNIVHRVKRSDSFRGRGKMKNKKTPTRLIPFSSRTCSQVEPLLLPPCIVIPAQAFQSTTHVATDVSQRGGEKPQIWLFPEIWESSNSCTRVEAKKRLTFHTSFSKTFSRLVFLIWLARGTDRKTSASHGATIS